MDNKSSQGLLAGTPDMPSSPFGPSKDVSYVPISYQAKDGTYSGVPGTEKGHPSPAFSSPGLSSMASPGPFQSLEQVRNFHEMKESDAVLKRRIRLLKFFLRLFTLILALYMIATMSLTFHKFFTTRNELRTVPGKGNTLITRGPWAKETKLWPTTVLLVTSSISFLVSAVVMAAYIRGIEAANAAHEYGSYLGVGVFAAHVSMWIAVAAAYRAGKGGEDLWGWTCDERAMDIQEQFAEVINFKRYCDVQTSSWITSLAQATLLLLSVAVYTWGYLRLRQQREMVNRFGEEVYEHREGRWSRFIPGRKG